MASIYDTQASPYGFRDDDQADAERKNRLDVATLTAVGRIMGQRAPGGAGAAPAGGAEPPPTPEQMGLGTAKQPAALAGTMRTAMATTAAPAPQAAPEGIQDFQAFIQNSNPMEASLRAKAAKAAEGQLDNPAAAYDQAAGVARENLDISQRNAREAARDELTLTYGGNASQTQTALRDVDQQAILDRRTLNRDLTAGRAEASRAGLASAIQSALGFATLDSQERLSRESLARQAAEGDKNRASSERVAFAGLAQQERALALNAMQFTSELDFRKSEAAAGRTEAEITRAWQAAQNERQLQSQEKVAFAGLDLEKQKFQAADANAKQGLALEASAQALQKLGMDREEAYRYASLAQAKGLAERGLTLQEMELELTKQGMDAEQARFVAGMAHQERLQTQDLESRLKIASLQIGSAERLAESGQRHQALEAERDRILARESQERGINATTALERAKMDFESAMADKGFLQSKELEGLKADFAAELQRQGYTQQSALQAADLQARAFEAEADRRFNAEQADLTRAFTRGERVDSERFASSMQAMEFQQQDRMARHRASLGLEAEDRRFAYSRALNEAQQAHEKAMQQTGITAEKAAQAADQAFERAMSREGFTNQQVLLAKQLQHEAAQTDKQLQQSYTLFMAEQAMTDARFAQEMGFNREQLVVQSSQFQQEFGLQAERFGLEKAQWESLKTDQAFNRDLELAMMGVQMWNGQDPASIQPFVERLATTMGTALGMDPTRLAEAIKANFQTTGGGGGRTPNAGTPTAITAATDKLDAMLDGLPARVTDNRQKIEAELNLAARNTTRMGLVDEMTGVGKQPTPQQAHYQAFQAIVKLGLDEKTAADLLITVVGADKFKAAYKAMTGKDWAA